MTGFLSFAQENFTGYLEPSVAINYKVKATYSHNFTFSNRSYFFNNEAYQLKTRQIDIAHFSDLKIKSNQSIALGVQYRFRDNFEPDRENELRLTQQYNSTFKSRNIRFGHRLRSEQRIQTSLTTHRFRYRFALDFPLQGENLDMGETYLVGSTESLLSVAKATRPSFDQRITTHIGYFLSASIKIQAGMEYRLENYNQETERVLFVTSSLILAL
ncbi:DUF2490 domain-containing protein [Cellulophaga sp. Hel_I_12]|uniref:DUF2490 domain-containing protein n=1 Tax=Cellulophaga sp. Hel_I_12 TaxID=1249972 RepID=UPI001E2E49F4|nr:DUF2490 domain-containing protein [Cellulophaga sp. Hel_I_12]